MPGKHKTPMLGWFPPAELSAWVRGEAARREVPFSVILTEAVAAKKAAEEAERLCDASGVTDGAR